MDARAAGQRGFLSLTTRKADRVRSRLGAVWAPAHERNGKARPPPEIAIRHTDLTDDLWFDAAPRRNGVMLPARLACGLSWIRLTVLERGAQGFLPRTDSVNGRNSSIHSLLPVVSSWPSRGDERCSGESEAH